RLAPGARQKAVKTLPALSHPYPQAAVAARAGRAARYRNLADLDCRAGRLPGGGDRARQGLRLSRRQRRPAVEFQKRADRLRAVSAQRSARPAARNIRRRHQPAFRRYGAALAVATHNPGKEKINIHNGASRDNSGLYGRNGMSDDGLKAVAVGRCGEWQLTIGAGATVRVPEGGL